MSRPRKFSARLLEGAILALVLPMVAAGATEVQPARIYLHKDWQVQSSCEVKASGEQTSSVGFDAAGWHKTDVPATVVGVLVMDKTYPDPNYGTNLKSFPGMNYSDMTIFANQEMPEGSPFRCSWWYRTEFTVPAAEVGKSEWLNFLGINYRANVWINEQKVADAGEVAGTYRSFEFNVSKFLKPGKTNALAVEVFAPARDDLGITWVDWNPTPPDKNMGIWKEVFLTSSGKVAVRNPFVVSKLGAEYKTAELTVSAELRNVSNDPVKGTLRAKLEGIELQQPVELSGGEWKVVKFTPEHTEKGHRLFKVNGRKVLIRGAAWAPDLLLRWSSPRLDADLAYVRDMGMNAIRLEGRLDRDEFFEKTDRLGILVMPGWTCCDAWERWKIWKDDQNRIAAASLRDQITRLRNHPS